MPLTNFDDEIALDLSLAVALGPLQGEIIPGGEDDDEPEIVSYAFDVALDGGAVTFASEDRDQAQKAWDAVVAALAQHGDLQVGGGVQVLASAVLAIGPVAEDEEEEGHEGHDHEPTWFFEILVPGSSLVAEFDDESEALGFWDLLQQEAGS
jgi:hypothetical protein